MSIVIECLIHFNHYSQGLSLAAYYVSMTTLYDMLWMENNGTSRADVCCAGHGALYTSYLTFRMYGSVPHICGTLYACCISPTVLKCSWIIFTCLALLLLLCSSSPIFHLFIYYLSFSIPTYPLIPVLFSPPSVLPRLCAYQMNPEQSRSIATPSSCLASYMMQTRNVNGNSGRRPNSALLTLRR